MDLSNSLVASLSKVGQLFFQTMKTRIESGNYPPGANDPRKQSTIPDATRIKAPEVRGSSHVLEIEIDLQKAPYAAAYEWGSGLWGDSHAKYPIAPRVRDSLGWPEGDWPGWRPIPGGLYPWKGWFTTDLVQHPGVAPRPYIRPTIESIRPEVRKLLAQEFKVGFLRGGKPLEIIK